MAPSPMVIDLISSSPPRARPSKRSPSNDVPATRLENIFDIDDHELKFAGMSAGLDFTTLDSGKSRRLSPRAHVLPQILGSDRRPIHLSDDEILPVIKISKTEASMKARLAGLGGAPPMSDAIEFSSSAPETKRRKTARASNPFDLSDELELHDDFFSSLPSMSQPSKSTQNGGLSERTANVLANLDIKRSRPAPIPAMAKFRRTEISYTKSTSVSVVGSVEDIHSASEKENKKAKPRRTKLTEEEKEKRADDRAVAKAAKEAEKYAEREQKRLAKEQKEQEKQKANEVAEVNKSTLDKLETCKEMILNLPQSLDKTLLGRQVEDFMSKLEIEVNYYEEEADLSGTGTSNATDVGHIIKWRRKVQKVYNPEEDCFHPAPERIKEEKHMLIYMTATQFATLAARQDDNTVAHISQRAMKANLDAHVYAIKRKYKGYTPIYLIEGLEGLLRKNKSAINRNYLAAARGVDLENPTNAVPTASQTRKRKQRTSTATDVSFFTSDLTDTLQLHLQLTHSPNFLLHHVRTAAETANWIRCFTLQLSLRPYKLQRQVFNDAHAGFCMDTGQVKTGVDVADTYVRMLQQLPRVTLSMGMGILEGGGVRKDGWKSAGALVRGFEREGRLMLQDVRKAVNKDGGMSDRKVGPAVSKRLYKLFIGMDPNEQGI